MKKLALLVGIAIGFVVGSKVGRGPYERLEGVVGQFLKRSDVQGALQTTSDTAAAVRDSAVDSAVHSATHVVDAASRTITDESQKLAEKATRAS